MEEKRIAMAGQSDTGASVHARRVIAYIILVLITFICLFWFYVLFINSTRSNADLTRGFSPAPGNFLGTNWDNLVHGTLPIFNGLINSLIVATLTAVFATYFSTMTAYAIHAYDFKLKKFIFTFILMVMMIPTQVTALGFLQLIGKMGLDDKFTPLIVPAIFLYEAVHGFYTSSFSCGSCQNRRIYRVGHIQQDCSTAYETCCCCSGNLQFRNKLE